MRRQFNYSSFPKKHIESSYIRALASIRIKKKKGRDLCCVWHIYKPTDIKYFLIFLRQFSDIDHYATFNFESCGEKFLESLSDINLMLHLSLYPISNRGRDFRIATQIFPDIIKNRYKFLTKLHFKERDQISQIRMSNNKALSIIKKHIQFMKLISLQRNQSKIIYGMEENILEQKPNILKNKIWLQKLCNKSNLHYIDLLNSSFISGGIFIISQPTDFLRINSFISDRDFELERNKKLDGLLCHALERFATFFATSNGYKINRITLIEKL